MLRITLLAAGFVIGGCFEHVGIHSKLLGDQLGCSAAFGARPLRAWCSLVRIL
jgi:hypothetical protein